MVRFLSNAFGRKTIGVILPTSHRFTRGGPRDVKLDHLHKRCLLELFIVKVQFFFKINKGSVG